MDPFGDVDESNVADFEHRAKQLETTERDLQLKSRQPEVQYTLAPVRSRVSSVLNRRTPIYRLPAEVLAMIFWYGNPAYDPNKLHGHLPSPVIVSHVSRHWRQTAIDTPML
ncbi:hypothetical protein PLICRDRAFT_172599 [Plicaturopsis crispa FD-325 SS-3]|nr:hypothetical protein PLICRDRAFT_172598 [Plicaturopsis crispa FD-325 SS-3]KII92522.1 hypothetical protein PLICRDRAFT_172599 [Plicaturopsis crispa FD-325 SS-3]